MPGRFGRSLVGWLALILIVLLVYTLLMRDRYKEISLGDFWNYAKNGQIVGTIVIRQSAIEGELMPNAPGLKKGEPQKFRVECPFATDYEFTQKLDAALKGTNTRYDYDLPKWWESTLPQLLIVLGLALLLWFMLFRRLGAATGGAGLLGSFGRSRHKVTTKEQSKVTFRDVAGIDEAKDELGEIIEFLKNPKKFQRLGGRIPRGVLLVGEPGCGKTLLAKAIAGEADVPFFSISGSDFVEMFVGVGASRVRDLFKQAKDNSPCIIFLDEIDAVGRRRGHSFTTGGHDEREQTLNAILVEMDGFDTSDQVIVIAATNRMDVLDPALTRPGRFDRQVNVPLPDLQGRYEILKIYAEKVRSDTDVDLHRLARGTPMFSGADLAALVNEAAIAATMAGKDAVTHGDLEEARDKVRWGRARKNRIIDEKDKEITAHHEAGHALVQLLLPEADPLHKVSIIPRGQMGGATFALPEKDRYLYGRKYCQAQLCIFAAGRVAEEMFCRDVTSGAQNDIAMATELAKKMVLDWGMSDRLGTINYANEGRLFMPTELSGKTYSDHTAQVVDQEIKRLVDEAQQRARKLIEEHRKPLEGLAEALVRYETLSAEEVEQIVAGKPLHKPIVDDLLEQEQARAAAPDAAAVPKPPLPESPAGPGAIPEPG